MGVQGLWELLAAAEESHDMTAFALQGIQRPRPRKLYRVGVDASLWFRQCQAPFTRAHARAGQNPELRTIFFRLAHLFTKPYALVFVGDGPDRPAVKRGTNVGKKAHWLTIGLRDLVEAFGFEWIEAPAEAEAELAAMNRSGLIDAIMSDDGDTLLFGAEIVIRNSSRKKDGNIISVYRAQNMFTHTTLHISRGGIVLLAVLAGGDYSKGLNNCGLRVAHGLARYGLGDALVACVMNSVDDAALRAALSTWWEDLRHYLRNDPNGFIGKRQLRLADCVPDDFPDLKVLRAYVRPLTSSPDNIALDNEFGRAMKFDLARLRNLCDRYFSWDDEYIRTQFHKRIWPGVVLRLVAASLFDVPFGEHQIPAADVDHLLGSIKRGSKKLHPSGYQQVRITLDARALFRASYGADALATAPDKFLKLSLQIPTLLLPDSFPRQALRAGPSTVYNDVLMSYPDPSPPELRLSSSRAPTTSALNVPLPSSSTLSCPPSASSLFPHPEPSSSTLPQHAARMSVQHRSSVDWRTPSPSPPPPEWWPFWLPYDSHPSDASSTAQREPGCTPSGSALLPRRSRSPPPCTTHGPLSSRSNVISGGTHGGSVIDLTIEDEQDDIIDLTTD